MPENCGVIVVNSPIPSDQGCMFLATGVLVNTAFFSPRGTYWPEKDLHPIKEEKLVQKYHWWLQAMETKICSMGLCAKFMLPKDITNLNHRMTQITNKIKVTKIGHK